MCASQLNALFDGHDRRTDDMRLFLLPLVLLASLILPYSLNADDILEGAFPAKQAEVAKAVHDVFTAADRGDLGVCAVERVEGGARPPGS